MMFADCCTVGPGLLPHVTPIGPLLLPAGIVPRRRCLFERSADLHSESAAQDSEGRRSVLNQTEDISAIGSLE